MMARNWRHVLLAALCLVSSSTSMSATNPTKCGRVVVRTRVCYCTDIGSGWDCRTVWVEAPVQVRLVSKDPGTRHPEYKRISLFALSDTTGVAMFECVPFGTYVVEGLFLGRESSPNNRKAVRGTGRVDEGWVAVSGDTIAVAGGDTVSTVIRRYFPCPGLFR